MGIINFFGRNGSSAICHFSTNNLFNTLCTLLGGHSYHVVSLEFDGTCDEFGNKCYVVILENKNMQ